MVLKSRDTGVDWSARDDPTREALCLKSPIPRPGADPWFDDIPEAIAICNGHSGGPICPMRTRCLKRALINNERHGVWGGMYAHDRKILKDKFPTEPEKWTWQPATERPRVRRRRGGTRPSPPSSPTAKSPPC